MGNVLGLFKVNINCTVKFQLPKSYLIGFKNLLDQAQTELGKERAMLSTFDEEIVEL